MAKWGLFVTEGISIGILFLYAYLIPPGPPPNSKAPGVALMDLFIVTVMAAGAALFVNDARRQFNQKSVKWFKTLPCIIGIPCIVIISTPIFIGAYWYR